MGNKGSFSLSISIWSVTFRMLRKYPRLLLPFFINALLEGLVLGGLFYFPRPPFSAVLAPPIKAFFGEPFLHYPNNFLLLPQIFYYGQVLIMMTAGVVMFGMAMGMVYQASSGEGEEVKIFGNLNRAIRRYASLIGVWLTTFIISLVILRGPHFLAIKFLHPTTFAGILLQMLFYAGIGLVFLAEALFIYAYPAIIVERRKFLGAIKRSFGVSKRVFLTTVILIAVPRVLDVAVTISKQNLRQFMNLTFPEVTLVILVFGIIVTFITDSLVFLTAGNLFVLMKETEKEV